MFIGLFCKNIFALFNKDSVNFLYIGMRCKFVRFYKLFIPLRVFASLKFFLHLLFVLMHHFETFFFIFSLNNTLFLITQNYFKQTFFLLLLIAITTSIIPWKYLFIPKTLTMTHVYTICIALSVL